MRSTRVRDVWVGAEHPWRAWVKQALFSSLPLADVVPATEDAAYRSESAPWAGKGTVLLGDGKVAVIVDLPGPEAIEVGLALGQRGLRPVLSINANSSADEVIDMKPILTLLAEGARFQSSFPTGPDVAPVFILDSRRDGDATPTPGRFDNRWTLFPTDLPSAEHLKAAHIHAVVIVQEGSDVKEDLRAIAWTYQRGGIAVGLANARDPAVVAMSGERIGWWPFMIGHFRRRFALKRRWDGSYGHRVPIPPEPSHG